MKKINEIKEVKAMLKSLEKEAISEIKETVSTAEEMPGVKRISPVCVTVSLNNICNNWNPKFYNTQLQVTEIISKIDTFSTLDQVAKYLSKLDPKDFNPNVLGKVSEILEEINA